MLSRDCDGCSELKTCRKRYCRVVKGEKVYCPDGTAHLVDDGSAAQNADLIKHEMERLQLEENFFQ